MTHTPERRETGDIARGFFLQAAGLFAAMVLALSILDGYQGSIGAAVILAVYVLGNAYRKRRDTSDTTKSPGGLRVGLATLIFFASGFMAVTGTIGVVVIAWLRFAYTPFEIDGWTISPQDGEIVGGLPHVLTLLAGGAVFLVLGVLLLHWRHGGLGVLTGRLQRHGIGVVLLPWLGETALLPLLSGGMTLVFLSVPLEMIVDAMSLGQTGGFLTVIERFPFLALGLASAAVLAVATVHLARDYTLFDDLVRALREERDSPPRRDNWLPALTAITLGGTGVMIGSMLWGLHIAFLAASASAPALVAGTTVGAMLGDWAIEMQAAERPVEDLIVMVGDNGFWQPEAPEHGLVKLMPGLDVSLEEAGLQPGCRIAVTAAAASEKDAARLTSGLAGWQPLPMGFGEMRTPDGEMPGRHEDEVADEPEKTLPLRYCVKVTCPVPVVWDAPAAVSLYSSHRSQRPDWMLNVFFDMFAAGRATTAGGYCTAEGELADSYQG